MSERNFSRRRRGGMRFRPSGGLGHTSQKPDREATEARAEVVGGTAAPEKVYDRRHAQEIDRAENIAASLPPEGAPHAGPAAPEEKMESPQQGLHTPMPVEKEKPFEPVPLNAKPK